MNKELAPKLNLTLGDLYSCYWSYDETVGYPISGDDIARANAK